MLVNRMGTTTLLLSLAVLATAYGHHASQGGIPGSEMYDKYSGKKIDEAASEVKFRIARQMPDFSQFSNPSQMTNFSPDKFTSMANTDKFMSAFGGSSGGGAGSPAPAEGASSEVKYRIARQMPDFSQFSNPSQMTNFSPDKFTSMANTDKFMSAFGGSSGGGAGSPAPAEGASSEVKYRIARQMPDFSQFSNPSQMTNFSPDKFTSMANTDKFMSAFGGSSGGGAGSPAPAEGASSEVKYRIARQMPDFSQFSNPSQMTNFSPDKFTSMANTDKFMSAFGGSSGGGAGSPAPAEGASSEVKFRIARQMPDFSQFSNPSQMTNFSPDKFTSMANTDKFMSAFGGSSGGGAGSPAPAEGASSEVKYRIARQMPDFSQFSNPSQMTNFSPDKFTSMANTDKFMSAFGGSSGGGAGSPAPAEGASSEVKYRIARQMPDFSQFSNPSQMTNFSPDKFTSMANTDKFMSAFGGSSGGGAGSPAPAEGASSEVKYRIARQMPDFSQFSNPSQMTNFSPDKFTSMANTDKFMSAFGGSSGGGAGSPAPAEGASSEVKYRIARQMPDFSQFSNPSQMTNFSPDKFTSMANTDKFMSAFGGSSGGGAGSPAPAEGASSEVKYRIARQMPDFSQFSNPSQMTNFSPDKFTSMANTDKFMSAFGGSSGGGAGSPAPAEGASSEVKYRIARQMPDFSQFSNPSQMTNFSPDKFTSMANTDKFMSAFGGSSGGGAGSPAPAEGASSEVKYRIARQMPDFSQFSNPSQMTNFSPDKFTSMANTDKFMSAFGGSSGGGAGSPAPAEGASSEVKYRIARQIAASSAI